jgi:hypothetical protein
MSPSSVSSVSSLDSHQLVLLIEEPNQVGQVVSCETVSLRLALQQDLHK